MTRRMYIIVIIVIFFCLPLCSCKIKAPQLELDNQNVTPTSIETNGDTDSSAYVSITYGRDNPNNDTGREMVFYTYDLLTKKIVEEGVIPFAAKYATGVVSKSANVIYFSGRADPKNSSLNDHLCEYNLSTGTVTVLEAENFSYNEIVLIDADTLLVMAVTAQHPITPALFDLKSGTFTYMADVNNEPFSLYTSGSSLLNYNHTTEMFVNIFQNEGERYSTEYHRFETEIVTNVALVKSTLTKDSEKIFQISLPLGSFIDNAVQLSENELLVERRDDYFDEDVGELLSNQSFYLLTFENNGKTSIAKTTPPFPVDNLNWRGYRTPDGGKTWYLLLGDKISQTGGLYSYDVETEELTPIILNNPSNNGYVIDFSFVCLEE